MKRILLIEDSRTILSCQKSTIKKELNYPIYVATTFKDAKEILEEHSDNIIVAMVDLNLPDAPDGESVDLVIKYSVPAIVFTATYDTDIRKKMMEKSILTYLTKDPFTNFSYALKLAKNLNENVDNKILVVDDSKTSLLLATMILEKFNYTVLTALDAYKALEVIDEHQDIKLVITDENMPNMDGLELVTTIRQKYDRNTMAIIGISASLDDELSIQYLKQGANDFLKRPYKEEEFINRVMINVEMIQAIADLKDVSTKDYLTGLYNRRYLFDKGEKLHQIAQRRDLSLSAIMIDIDHFKKVNDTYGHLVGDRVIQEVSQCIHKNFRESDIVARYGGEEFCILALDFDVDTLLASLEELLKKVGALHVSVDEGEMSVTISIGVTQYLSTTLQAMIDLADIQLYEAKESGRNCIRMEQMRRIDANSCS